MGGITLADPYLKTTRAKEHLDALREELKAFIESKPCKFRSQDDVKNQRCHILVDIKDTPDRIPLILGDILYNLRSSLDQVVWCLAKLTLDYPENTAFPILENSDAPLIKRRTNGVPVEAVRIIESLQPYHWRNAIKSHFLYKLNKLGNIDKHMRIPVHSSAVNFHLPASIMQVASLDNDGVMHIPIELKAELKSYVALDPDISFNVVFGDSYRGIECDFKGIEDIYDFVTEKVIPRFACFFK